MCDTVWMWPQSHNHRLSDPISLDMCRSGPVLSVTSAIVTTGVGAGENQEVGLWIIHNEEFIAVADCQCSRHRLDTVDIRRR